MTIEATTVVSFNDTSSNTPYVFNLKLDDVLNVDSEGKTKTYFNPDDVVYIQSNKSSNVTVGAVVSTDGSVSKQGTSGRQGEATNLFSTRDEKDTGEFTISEVPSSVPDITYAGRPGYLIKMVSDIGVVSYTPNIAITPFLATFNYNYSCDLYKLTPPVLVLEDNETYNIAVVFYITVSEA